MKLRHKLSLLGGVVLIFTMGLCMSIQLRWSWMQIQDAVYEKAKEKQQALAGSFQRMVNYHGLGGGEAAQRALLQYCFSQLADETGVLVAGGEILYARADPGPTEFLRAIESGSIRQWAVKQEGKLLLITGSRISIKGYADTEYLVYTVEDITALHGERNKLLIRSMALSVGGIAVSLCAIWLLVGYALKPLEQLQEAAARIARGEYDQRAEVTSRNEIGAVADSFNQMAGAVQSHIGELTEAAFRQKLFAGAVSHEFKTPLTTILMNAETLQAVAMTEEERSEALERIIEQGKWMEGMTRKMMKLITLRQELQISFLSVPELLERVRESTAGCLSEQGVSLVTDCRMDGLSGDGDLLQAALVNLVENGAKASQPGQFIHLTAWGSTIRVTDQGCGIAQEDLQRITEPFYTADKSRSKKQGGTGLGLAIVKEICLAHGAELKASSTPGQGTTMAISFPVTKP